MCLYNYHVKKQKQLGNKLSLKQLKQTCYLKKKSNHIPVTELHFPSATYFENKIGNYVLKCTF